MNFHDTLSFLVTQIGTFYKIEIEKELRSYELHSGQIFILFELWKTDGLSQIELSQRLRVSPPAINKMVKSLAGNGFVYNSPNSQDGRIMQVFLSPKGAAVRPQIEEKWRLLEEKLVANLTNTEQLVLTQLFERLKENLLMPSRPE